jgi:hypothetical protein
MQNAQFLNSVGLILGMLAVLLIFIWGPPQPNLEEGVGVALDTATSLKDGTRVSDLEEQNKRRRRRHWVMSSLGLALVFLGFAVQLWAVWA